MFDFYVCVLGAIFIEFGLIIFLRKLTLIFNPICIILWFYLGPHKVQNKLNLTFLALFIGWFVFYSLYLIFSSNNTKTYNDNINTLENSNEAQIVINNIKKLLSEEFLPSQYYCSMDVIINSRTIGPYKYITKYFEIPESQELYHKVVDKINNRTYKLDIDKLKDLYKKLDELLIKNNIHNKYAIYRYYKIPYNINNICPYKKYIFFNNNSSTIVTCDEEFYKGFKEYLDKKFNFINETKNQRALMTPQLREQVLKRDNFTCCQCGNSIYKEPNLLLEVDHIIPIAKGGKTVIDNLQTLCWKCNRSKSSK